MKCDNCQKTLDIAEMLEIQLKRFAGTIYVCSLDCRSEWLAGYAEHVQEQLEELVE